MDKIRFGIIGCGYIARKAFIPALKKSKYAEIVAVASRDSNKAKSVSVEFVCAGGIILNWKHSNLAPVLVYLLQIPTFPI